MNEKVIKVFKENIWHVATVGEMPNVVPIGIKDVMDDGKFVFENNFLDKTLANILENGKVAISAFGGDPMEGYQVKGKAEYVTEGEIIDHLRVLGGELPGHGAVVVTVEEVYVTTPGADAGKKL